jgi:hypothetical protein
LSMTSIGLALSFPLVTLEPTSTVRTSLRAPLAHSKQKPRLGGDAACCHRSRPTGIKRKMSNDLADFVFRDPIVERTAEMTLYSPVGNISDTGCIEE